MEIRQLHYFVQVCKKKSFLKAAENCFVSQQALSKAIQNLEKDLGVVLLLRSNSGIRLTEAGDLLFDKAIHILSEVDDLSRKLNRNTENKEIVSVGFTTGIMKNISLQKILAFEDMDQNMKISLIGTSDHKCEQMVFDEILDMGYINGIGDITLCNYKLLRENSTWLAVSINNPLAQRKTIEMKDLEHENLLIGPSDYNVNCQLREACREAGFDPNINFLSADLEILKQMVSYNKGVFTFPENTLPEMVAPDIKVFNIVDAPAIYSIYLITKKGHNLSRSAKGFRDYFEDIL